MEQNIFFVFNKFQRHSFYNVEKTCKMIFCFVFMLKMVFFKKRYFYDDFLKNFAIFFVIVFSFSLAARPLLSFFFSFSYMPGQSRVSTVLFALYLSLFFFSLYFYHWLVCVVKWRQKCTQRLSSIGKAVRPIAEREIATKQYKE